MLLCSGLVPLLTCLIVLLPDGALKVSRPKEQSKSRTLGWMCLCCNANSLCPPKFLIARIEKNISLIILRLPCSFTCNIWHSHLQQIAHDFCTYCPWVLEARHSVWNMQRELGLWDALARVWRQQKAYFPSCMVGISWHQSSSFCSLSTKSVVSAPAPLFGTLLSRVFW